MPIPTKYLPLTNQQISMYWYYTLLNQASHRLKSMHQCTCLAFKYVYTFIKWLKIMQLDTIESTWLNKRNDNHPQEEEMQRWKMEIQLVCERDDIFRSNQSTNKDKSSRDLVRALSRPKWIGWISRLETRNRRSAQQRHANRWLKILDMDLWISTLLNI